MLKSRRAWIVTIGAVIALFVLWYLTPFYRGVLMARLDHACGHYELKVIGGPPLPPEKEAEYAKYAQLLQEGYAVKLNVVAGCVVTDDLMQYVEGYNSVSQRLLVARHGLDVFEKCRRIVWPE